VSKSCARQRQWLNTFDSIEDMICLHDANHKILESESRLDAAP